MMVGSMREVLGTVRARGIRVKLIYFIVISAIIPGLIMSFIAWQRGTAAFNETIGIYNQSASINVAHRLAGAIESEIETAAVLAERPELLEVLRSGSPGSSRNIAPARQRIVRHLRGVAQLNKKHDYRFFIADADGRVVLKTKEDPTTDLSSSRWWSVVLDVDNGRPFFGNIRSRPSTGEYTYEVVVPIRDDGERTVGVLVLNAALKGLLVDFSRETSGKSIHTDIFDQQGRLILDNRKILADTMSPEMTKKLMTDKSTWKIERDEHNRLSVIGVSRVVFSEDFSSDTFSAKGSWNVMIAQRLSAAHQPLLGLMRETLALGVIALIIIMMVAYFSSRNIVEPLGQLAAGAHAVGRGDLDFKVDTSAHDEIGVVAQEFNKMTSALKESREQVQETNLQLLQKSKAKSEFLANMSHELRTPLNSIIGFAEVLQDKMFGPLNERQERYTENIRSSGSNLLELINDVLDISKIEAGKLELRQGEFNIRETLSAVIASVAPLAKKKDTNVSLTIEERVQTMRADEGKFRQIILNLLSNAIKFTPERGKVAVIARHQHNSVVVSVNDTGIGIAPEHVKTIFNKFSQVAGSDSREYGGTGLGLALTKQLVELHDGTISVQSELHQGSTFTVTIPFGDLRETAQEARNRDASRAVNHGQNADHKRDLAGRARTKSDAPTIMIVDDDYEGAELLRIHIEKSGYDTLVAPSKDEAVKLAQKVDLFAICVDTTESAGWQFLNQLKGDPATQDIPVIISSMDQDQETTLSLGAVGHLTRPVQRDQLVGILSRCRRTQEKPFVVLVVDDNPQAVELVAALLEPEGFGVIKAYGGEEAIQKVVELRPDLLILDLMMPKVSGFDVIDRLSETREGESLPIIVLTAKELSDEDRRILDGRSTRVLKKAVFQRDGLVREIRRLENLDPHRAMLIDEETGLYNHRFFHRRLSEEVRRARRYQRAFSILLVDITGPGELELPEKMDSKSVMRELSALLKENIRGADPIARYSKSEFVIILPETTKAGALKASAKIADIYGGCELGQNGLLTCSISAATFFDDADDAQTMIDAIEADNNKVRESTAKNKPRGE